MNMDKNIDLWAAQREADRAKAQAKRNLAARYSTYVSPGASVLDVRDMNNEWTGTYRIGFDRSGRFLRLHNPTALADFVSGEAAALFNAKNVPADFQGKVTF